MKRFLQMSFLEPFTAVGPLLVRLITGFIMIPAGYGKIQKGVDQFAVSVARIGFPAPTVFAWLAVLAELVGGLFLVLGLLTRWSAVFVAFTMAVAVYVTRNDNYALALVLMFTSISLIFSGPGKFSLDELIFRRLK